MTKITQQKVLLEAVVQFDTLTRLLIHAETEWMEQLLGEPRDETVFVICCFQGAEGTRFA